MDSAKTELTLREKFLPVIVMIDFIYHVGEKSVDETFKNIQNAISKLDVSPKFVLKLIDWSAKNHLPYLREHFELFKKVVKEYNVELDKHQYGGPFMAAIGLEYNLCAPRYWKDFDEIFEVDEKDSPVNLVLHDKVEKLKTNCPGPEEKLWSNYYRDPIRMFKLADPYHCIIDWAACFGAVKCFHYLLEKNYPVTLRTLTFALQNGNKEIIDICLEKTKGQPKEDMIRSGIPTNAVRGHNYEVGKQLFKDGLIEEDYGILINTGNLELFFHVLAHGTIMANSDFYEDVKCLGPSLGIPSLVDTILEIFKK